MQKDVKTNVSPVPTVFPTIKDEMIERLSAQADLLKQPPKPVKRRIKRTILRRLAA